HIPTPSPPPTASTSFHPPTPQREDEETAEEPVIPSSLRRGRESLKGKQRATNIPSHSPSPPRPDHVSAVPAAARLAATASSSDPSTSFVPPFIPPARQSATPPPPLEKSPSASKTTASPEPDNAQRSRQASLEHKEKRAKTGASKRVTGERRHLLDVRASVPGSAKFPCLPRTAAQENLVNLHRYEPKRDVRRKAYTTGLDSLNALSRKFAIKTNATVFMFVASHEVYNSGDHPPPLASSWRSQPVTWGPNPSEADLAMVQPVAPWAKFAIDCPSFTTGGAFEQELTPVAAVYERMIEMFEAVVRPGQELESMVRKAAAAAARKERPAPPPRKRTKPNPKVDKEAAEKLLLQADQLEAAQANIDAMTNFLLRHNFSAADITAIQVHASVADL
ncbi:hypothetical protein P7C70_g6870, partial [Phenoliferia sp. Uapishka_3]